MGSLVSTWKEQRVVRNLMWVLSKLQLRVEKLPRWGERIAIETWGKRIERFYALRDFVVSTPDGERLASATSAWMILDRDTYRPQRLETLMKDFPWRPDSSVVETSLRKVDEPGSDVSSCGYRVCFSDIDVNAHVTAARYLQWMLDSYPVTALTGKELKAAEISFLAEAVLGDEVIASLESRPGHDLCRMRRAGDDQELCRARIEWRESARQSALEA